MLAKGVDRNRSRFQLERLSVGILHGVRYPELAFTPHAWAASGDGFS